MTVLKWSKLYKKLIHEFDILQIIIYTNYNNNTLFSKKRRRKPMIDVSKHSKRQRMKFWNNTNVLDESDIDQANSVNNEISASVNNEVNVIPSQM